MIHGMMFYFLMNQMMNTSISLPVRQWKAHENRKKLVKAFGEDDCERTTLTRELGGRDYDDTSNMTVVSYADALLPKVAELDRTAGSSFHWVSSDTCRPDFLEILPSYDSRFCRQTSSMLSAVASRRFPVCTPIEYDINEGFFTDVYDKIKAAKPRIVWMAVPN